MNLLLFENKNFKSLQTWDQDWTSGTFINCLFEHCHWQMVDWRKTRFQGCQFKQCSLSLCMLDACRLHQTTFVDCKLTGLEFFKCEKRFFEIHCKQCFLQACNFAELSMKKASFQGSRLHEVYFTQVDLHEGDFSHTDLKGSLFHHCNLTRANFIEAKNYSIDPQANKIAKARFSFPEVVHLLDNFDIRIEYQ